MSVCEGGGLEGEECKVKWALINWVEGVRANHLRHREYEKGHVEEVQLAGEDGGCHLALGILVDARKETLATAQFGVSQVKCQEG